jgi:hypothetical protein
LPVPQSCGSATTQRRSPGCAGASRPTAIFPLPHFNLATALALLGLRDEARATAKAGLALEPGFTIRRFRAFAPSDHPAFLAGRERAYEGMRMAGVPEG